jgi:hypothetical protein
MSKSRWSLTSALVILDFMTANRHAPGTTRVTLRLDRDTETISGTLAEAHGDERPFWGWLDLSAELDRIRAIDHCVSLSAQQPRTEGPHDDTSPKNFA